MRTYISNQILQVWVETQRGNIEDSDWGVYLNTGQIDQLIMSLDTSEWDVCICGFYVCVCVYVLVMICAYDTCVFMCVFIYAYCL
jgi:hypothetical protein